MDQPGCWQLTGKVRTRETFFGLIVLQVEERRDNGRDAADPLNWISWASMQRWRNARGRDLDRIGLPRNGLAA